MRHGLLSNYNVFRSKRKIKCFAEELKKLRAYTIVDLGIRVIEVKQITGTVDKCAVLDNQFRNLENTRRGERLRMTELDDGAAGGYDFFPPIEAYLLQREYYVLDGNRRAAAAKAHGIAYLDAHVREYVDQDDRAAVKGVVLQRQFEQATRLIEITLHHPAGYADLLREVTAFAHGRELKESARQWFAQVFWPMLTAIRKSSLPAIYPELRAEDIFVVIANFYHEFMGGLPAKAVPATIISGFLFARKLPHQRTYRRFPFRIVLALLKRLRQKAG